MKRLLSVILAALGLAALVAVSYASHSWGSYHWARTANPFTLKFGDNVPSAWDAYLLEALADWTTSNVLDAVRVDGSTTAKRCRPSSGRVEVCATTYGKNGWLGLASIWVSGSHITQGTAKMNDSYFNTAAYNTPAWRRLVMCQEIAHTFGLDHQDENFSNGNLGTCMDYTSNPTGNEHPDAHDYAQLEEIYEHLDSTTSASQTSARGAMPPAMTDIDFEGPGQWGRLIRSTRNDRTQLFELDFGGGHKIFTFVIWADEEDREHGNRH
jgi:hypothetical protein